MSRSWRALAEGCAWAVSALSGLGNWPKDKHGSNGSDRIGAYSPLTSSKWMAVVGVVVLAFAPATALGRSSHCPPLVPQLKTKEATAPARATAPAMQVLAFGAGYSDVNGSASVRTLQRRLATEGYAPGRIDGLYGPRTERAVISFQAAHGLQVDGIAGPHTFAVLRQVGARATTHPARTLSNPSAATTHRCTAPAGGTRHPRRRPAKARPRSASGRNAARRARHAPGSNPVVGWVLLIVALGGAVLLATIAGKRFQRRAAPEAAASANSQPQSDGNGRRSPINPVSSTGVRLDEERFNGARDVFRHAWLLERQGDLDGALAAYRQADQLGHPGAACNLGVMLEERGDLDGAEAAYRRSAKRSQPSGAFNLAALLEQRGALEEALAAYRRADLLGHAGAACNLGVLLEQQGDLDGAEAAYCRADARGEASGTFNRGVILERRGEVAAALAAFQRAASIGPPDVRSVAHAAAAELSAGVDRERRGLHRG